MLHDNPDYDARYCNIVQILVCNILSYINASLTQSSYLITVNQAGSLFELPPKVLKCAR